MLFYDEDGNLMPTMLEQAVTHIRAGEIEKARPLLIEVLKQNPGNEIAWLWMTKCVDEPEQKRYCFEKVLKLNPQNQYALRGLRHLTQPVSVPAPLTQPKEDQQPVSQPEVSRPEVSQPQVREPQVSEPQVSQPQAPEPQPAQKRGLFEILIIIASVGVGLFLVALCLYAWWVAR
jgi:hypothetical protein